MKNISLRKIITRGVLDMATLEWLKDEEQSHLHLGPLAHAIDQQVSGLTAYSLLDPQTITTTTASPSGYWRDISNLEGYMLAIVSFGTITATSAQAQLQSSASSTGSSPANNAASSAYPYGGLLPAVLAASSPSQQVLALPPGYFTNRYAGVSIAVAGAGNVPVSVVLLGTPRPSV